MAAVPIYIIGTITTAAPKSGEVSGSGIEQCVISGLASIEGLSVGGGPIVPPEQPPSIWPSPGHPAHPIAPGGEPPHPAHPIELPPIVPGGPPITIWPGVPTHPIVLPPPPTEGVGPGGGKPPPPDGGWGYHPDYGWGYFPGPGQPGPK